MDFNFKAHYALQGFISSCWPIDGRLKDIFMLFARKNGLTCSIMNATVFFCGEEAGDAKRDNCIQVSFWKDQSNIFSVNWCPHIMQSDDLLLSNYASSAKAYFKLCSDQNTVFMPHSIRTSHKPSCMDINGVDEALVQLDLVDI